MQITNRRLSELTPYAANAKKHDKRQINNVAESIKQYGFVQPIVIDRDGVIVIGHCRAMAAKKLGMEEVPCVCVDDLTPEQVNALRLVDKWITRATRATGTLTCWQRNCRSWICRRLILTGVLKTRMSTALIFPCRMGTNRKSVK